MTIDLTDFELDYLIDLISKLLFKDYKNYKDLYIIRLKLLDCKNSKNILGD